MSELVQSQSAETMVRELAEALAGTGMRLSPPALARWKQRLRGLGSEASKEAGLGLANVAQWLQRTHGQAAAAAIHQVAELLRMLKSLLAPPAGAPSAQREHEMARLTGRSSSSPAAASGPVPGAGRGLLDALAPLRGNKRTS